MKGSEISINLLVIVVLALIILLAVLALYFGVWPSSSSGISLESAKNNACQMLMSMGCKETELKDVPVYNFDANKDGRMEPGSEQNPIMECPPPQKSPLDPYYNDNLFYLCYCWYGKMGEEGEDCKADVCNCPA